MREVTALRFRGRRNSMTIVPPTLTINFRVERQRGSGTEVDGHRWKDAEAALAIVESVLEPLARRNQSISNGACLVERAGGICTETAESGAADAATDLDGPHRHRFLEHQIDERSRAA